MDDTISAFHSKTHTALKYHIVYVFGFRPGLIETAAIQITFALFGKLQAKTLSIMLFHVPYLETHVINASKA